MHETALGPDLLDIVIAGQVEKEAVGEQDMLAAMDQDSDRQPVENPVIVGRARRRKGRFRLPCRARSLRRRAASSGSSAWDGASSSRRAPSARAISRKALRSALERLEVRRRLLCRRRAASAGFGSADWCWRELRRPGRAGREPVSSPAAHPPQSSAGGISSGGRNGSVSSLTRLCAIRSADGLLRSDRSKARPAARAPARRPCAGGRSPGNR